MNTSRDPEAAKGTQTPERHNVASKVRSYLASTYGLKGESEHAAAELTDARRLSPDDRYSSIARLRAVEHYRSPKIQALREDTYFAGLRKAGVPEE